MTDRDKAENLWQTLNAIRLMLEHDSESASQSSTIDYIQKVLKDNRPCSEQQNKLFAQKVLEELPLDTGDEDFPIVRRLTAMCKDELGIED